MSKVPQTEQDLKKQLQDQLDLLVVLADSYDVGKSVIAKSIATAVRVLVYDTQKSHSLLGQLGMKTRKFYDTSLSEKNDVPTDIIRSGSFCGLVGITVGAKQTFVPYLDDVPAQIFGYVEFDEYWNRIIFIDQHHNSFTRKNIILAVANQDGGAHVDPKIEERYKQLSRENSLGWKISLDGKIWEDSQGSELAAVRQIGHEILRTLMPKYPHKKMVTFGGGVVMGGMSWWIGKPKEVTKKIILHRKKSKVGRNEKCPCGSGLKYKKCHGK
ncbi:SEC-C domain-containing protein [Patescibacteria group bacterium]|nr:SEC-C domain-containing protein [Patescibacteria group bacterium]